MARNELLNDTERKILFVILSMFSEGKRVTIKGISRESGLSRQNIYYYINKHNNKSFKELLEKDEAF
jgi:predicted DNA binding protein